MTEWTDHELDTARLRIRDAAEREQVALFASTTPLSTMSASDRDKHLALSRELAIDLEATRTLDVWTHRVVEPDAPKRWATTLEHVRDSSGS